MQTFWDTCAMNIENRTKYAIKKKVVKFDKFKVIFEKL